MKNILAMRLKQLRERKGLTQKRAAEIFGITNFQLSRYENGQSNPDPDLIKTFAKYYDVTTDYLLGMTDSQKPSANENSDDEKEMLEFFRKPEVGLFFKDMKEAPEEQLEELREIWEIIKKRSKKRT